MIERAKRAAKRFMMILCTASRFTRHIRRKRSVRCLQVVNPRETDLKLAEWNCYTVLKMSLRYRSFVRSILQRSYPTNILDFVDRLPAVKPHLIKKTVLTN